MNKTSPLVAQIVIFALVLSAQSASVLFTGENDQNIGKYAAMWETDENDLILEARHIEMDDLLPNGIPEERYKRETDDNTEGSGHEENFIVETNAATEENIQRIQTTEEIFSEQEPKAKTTEPKEELKPTEENKDKEEAPIMVTEQAKVEETTKTEPESKPQEVIKTDEDESTHKSKKGRKFSDDSSNHTEELNHEQSNHAEIAEITGPGSIGEFDNKVNNMPAKALDNVDANGNASPVNLNPQDNKETDPKTIPETNNVGASNKAISKASKDTSILVFLFVAVVLIGVVAFAYNSIKKRRNQSKDNGQNLQDIETPTGTDKNVNLEREMEPLMNGAELNKPHINEKTQENAA